MLPIITVVEGDEQIVLAGQRSENPIKFRVTNSEGEALVGARVDFAALGLAGGSLLSTTDFGLIDSSSPESILELNTDSQGEIEVYYVAP